MHVTKNQTELFTFDLFRQNIQRLNQRNSRTDECCHLTGKNHKVVQHPLAAIQDLHYGRLESLDYAARLEKTHRRMFQLYYHAYQETFKQGRDTIRRYSTARTRLRSTVTMGGRPTGKHPLTACLQLRCVDGAAA